MRTRGFLRRGFTLIEILVVVSIISMLMSLLLPSMSKARESSKAAVCAANHRQLAVAATTYSNTYKDWMNPIEDWWYDENNTKVEVTCRVILFPYVGRNPQVFDCPSEEQYMYSDGFSAADEKRAIALGGPITTDRERWSKLYGVIHPLERWNFGGIGVAGVHWFRGAAPDLSTRPRSMPFGRPIESGYKDGLRKFSRIRSPSRLIWFGDGGGDENQVQWGNDNGWWIRSPASDYSQGDPGFNRLLLNNYGCRRHSEKANYAFADGHVERLNANAIHCMTDDCWWSILPNVHRYGTTTSGP